MKYNLWILRYYIAKMTAEKLTSILCNTQNMGITEWQLTGRIKARVQS